MLIKNGATPTIQFWLINTSDGSPATSETALVDISKAGGAWTRTTNSATHVGRGMYKVTLTSAETDTVGQLAISAYAQGTDTTYTNKDGTVYEWRDIHEIYSTVNVETTGSSTVAATLSDAERNEIANFVLRRDLTEVMDLTNAADGVDAKTGLSLIGALALQLFPRLSQTSPTKITVYEDDGVTEFYSMTINGFDSTTSLPNNIDLAVDS